MKKWRKFIEKIFSIKNDNTCYKVFCIFGIKIIIKSKIVFLKNELNKVIMHLKVLDATDLVKPCYYIAPPLGPDYNIDMAFAFSKKLPSIYELYDKQEIAQIRSYQNVSRKFVDEGDYYRYKNFKLPIKHIAPEVFYYKHGIDRIKNLNYILDNKTIIDAGAFIGDSMLIFRDKFPKNEIISFEPVEKIYNLLLKTIELNECKNVKAENCGLGDRECVLWTDNSLHYPYVSRTRTTLNAQAINVVTLDSYCKKHRVKVGLIKSDIEGFEQKFLEGAKKTIISQRPILLISIYHNYNDFFKIKPMIESWNLGYRFDFFRGVDGQTTFGDTMLICEPR